MDNLMSYIMLAAPLAWLTFEAIDTIVWFIKEMFVENRYSYDSGS